MILLSIVTGVSYDTTTVSVAYHSGTHGSLLKCLTYKREILESDSKLFTYYSRNLVLCSTLFIYNLQWYSCLRNVSQNQIIFFTSRKN